MHLWKNGYPQEDSLIMMLVSRADHTVSGGALYDGADDLRQALEQEMFVVLALTEVGGCPSMNIHIDECRNGSVVDRKDESGGQVGGGGGNTTRTNRMDVVHPSSPIVSFVGTMGINGHALRVFGRIDVNHSVGRCVFEMHDESEKDNPKRTNMTMLMERKMETMVSSGGGGGGGGGGENSNKGGAQLKSSALETMGMRSNALELPAGTPPTTPQTTTTRKIFSPASRRKRKKEMEELF
jgi:hypothetical protein